MHQCIPDFFTIEKEHREKEKEDDDLEPEENRARSRGGDCLKKHLYDSLGHVVQLGFREWGEESGKASIFKAPCKGGGNGTDILDIEIDYVCHRREDKENAEKYPKSKKRGRNSRADNF